MPVRPYEVLCLAYRGVSPVSRLIRWFSWGDYSHIAAMHAGTGQVIEAWHKRGKDSCKRWWQGEVRLLPSMHEGHTSGTVVDVFRMRRVRQEQHEAMWRGLMAEVGKDYDFGGIWGFLRRKHRENPRKWFCSELYFAKAVEQLVPLLERVEPWKVSPSMLVCSPKLERVESVAV